MRALKWAVVLGLGIGAIGLAIAATTVEPLRFRVARIVEKAQGHYPEASWNEFLTMLKPGSGIWLAELPRWNSLFPVVKNPFNSHADIKAGTELFANNCGRCHGADGSGGVGPALRGLISPRTESDWAAFRTVRYGIPGTPMTGLDLDWANTWRAAGYLRSMVAVDVPRAAAAPVASVTFERLLNADKTPQDWLMYAGDYAGRRYSGLNEITAENVNRLRVAWVFQPPTDYRRLEATPLVADGRMYVSYPPANVAALDAGTGKLIWRHEADLPSDLQSSGLWFVNRGVALLEDKVIVGTLDARIKALDAATGKLLWQKRVADHRLGYGFTSAPLAIEGAVVIGNSGGDFATRGFVTAYEVATGKELWRFETIPQPGEPGIETWGGDSWKHGGVATWMSGTYDPQLKRVYWGTGNPAPDHFGDVRPGDNLYANSLIALDAATGKLAWHFQFTPHDLHDWDSTQVPVQTGDGRILFANRNGFLYSLERATGKFQWGKAYVKQTWAASLESNGRPVRLASANPSPEGTVVYPSIEGATNWWPPAYDAARDILYVPSMERGSMFYLGKRAKPTQEGPYLLGSSRPISGELMRTGIKAFRGSDGTVLWEHRNAGRNDVSETGGLLATAGGVLFGADEDRAMALDAATGKELWQLRMGGRIVAAPMSYSVAGKQYVALSTSGVVIALALPDDLPRN
jgi:alcohol dehydrogenase (cytochrome c)